MATSCSNGREDQEIELGLATTFGPILHSAFCILGTAASALRFDSIRFGLGLRHPFEQKAWASLFLRGESILDSWRYTTAL